MEYRELALEEDQLAPPLVSVTADACRDRAIVVSIYRGVAQLPHHAVMANGTFLQFSYDSRPAIGVHESQVTALSLGFDALIHLARCSAR